MCCLEGKTGCHETVLLQGLTGFLAKSKNVCCRTKKGAKWEDVDAGNLCLCRSVPCPFCLHFAAIFEPVHRMMTLVYIKTVYNVYLIMPAAAAAAALAH